MLAAVNHLVAQPRQKVWPHGSATGWRRAQFVWRAASRQVTDLRLCGAAERLIAECANEVGGGRGHPLAVARFGVERAEAPLA